MDDGDLAIKGDSPRLDLDDFTESTVERRVARRMPVDSARVLEDVLERMGACECEVGGSNGEMPAALVTDAALSMYFSIRRSLFQFMYRNKSEAVFSCIDGHKLALTKNVLITTKTYIHTEDATDVLNVSLHEFFHSTLGERLVINLIGFMFPFRCNFEIIIKSVHVHFCI